MSKEEFKWSPLVGAEIEIDDRVIIFSAGDGYEQRRRDGINSEITSYNGFKFLGHKDEIFEIRDFLRRQGRSKSFILDIPDHDKILMRLNSPIKMIGKGAGNYELTVSFIQVFD